MEIAHAIDISIHALHEESDLRRAYNAATDIVISIHALHEESDRRVVVCYSSAMVFQSTLSMRRATRTVLGQEPYRHISIHALHEESDL